MISVQTLSDVGKINTQGNLRTRVTAGLDRTDTMALTAVESSSECELATDFNEFALGRGVCRGKRRWVDGGAGGIGIGSQTMLCGKAERQMGSFASEKRHPRGEPWAGAIIEFPREESRGPFRLEFVSCPSEIGEGIVRFARALVGDNFKTRARGSVSIVTGSTVETQEKSVGLFGGRINVERGTTGFEKAEKSGSIRIRQCVVRNCRGRIRGEAAIQ